MKNKITSFVLLGLFALSMASCASRRYGCPSTAYHTAPAKSVKS